MKRLFLIIFTILLLLGILFLVFTKVLNNYGRQAANPRGDHLLISISRGQTFNRTLQKLVEANVIVKPAWFKLYTRLKGFDRKIKAGEYQLSSAMTPQEILNILSSGNSYLHRLTIPEGLNLRQIAAQAAASGLVSETDFLAAAHNPQLLAKYSIPAKTAEGYLFPDTYFFPKSTTAEKIISTMIQHLQANISPEWMKRADQMGFNLHQIVTLASIIEKETAAANERALISSVFHNRLKVNMRLQTDPTVIYGLASFDGNLTRKHLTTPTAYNTYIIYGLPPGPISNPGRAALEAVLFYPDTPYLYFVSKGNGNHYFSKNYQEHLRAVHKYQLAK